MLCFRLTFYDPHGSEIHSLRIGRDVHPGLWLYQPVNMKRSLLTLAVATKWSYAGYGVELIVGGNRDGRVRLRTKNHDEPGNGLTARQMHADNQCGQSRSLAVVDTALLGVADRGPAGFSFLDGAQRLVGRGASAVVVPPLLPAAARHVFQEP